VLLRAPHTQQIDERMARKSTAGNKSAATASSNPSTKASRAARSKDQRSLRGGGAPAAVVTRGLAPGPKVAGGPKGTVIFSNEEFIGDLTALALGTQTPIFASGLNPSTGTFPWLSRIAVGYELYRFRRLRMTYSPSCPSNTWGMVVGAFEYDPNDAPPASKQVLSAYEGAKRGSVWTKTTWDLVPPAGWFYVGAAPPGAEARFQEVAKFYLGIYGHTVPNTVLGELTVSYEVEFCKPEMGPVNPSEAITFSGGDVTNLVGTSITTAGDLMVDPVKAGAGTASMTSKVAGNYLLTFTITSFTTSNSPYTTLPLSFQATHPSQGTGQPAAIEWAFSWSPGAPNSSGVIMVTVPLQIGSVLLVSVASGVTALVLARLRLAAYRVTNG